MNIKNPNQQKTCSVSNANCQFCNRPLKNPDSIKAGYGLSCGKKNGLVKESKKKIIISKQLSKSLLDY